MLFSPTHQEPQSPTKSRLLGSKPTALSDFKITRQQKDVKEQSPRKEPEKYVPELRELQPALSEQFHLLRYLKDMDEKVDNAFELHEMRIQARYNRILQMTNDLKKALELAQARYEKMYQEMSNSDLMLSLQREIQLAISFFVELKRKSERISGGIAGNRQKMKINKQIYQEKKRALHAVCHENLAMVTKIYRLKQQIKAKKLLKTLEQKPQLTQLVSPRRITIHSPIYSVNKVKLKTLKPLDSFDTQEASKHLSTEVTADPSSRSLRLVSHEVRSPLISPRMEMDEAAILRREIKNLQLSNQKEKQRIASKCVEAIELSSLYNDCFSVFEKQLYKLQATSKNGLQGTLLFVLLDELNRRQFSEFGPSQLTLTNFSRHMHKPFAKQSEGEANEIVHKVFKKMDKIDAYNNEDRLNGLIAHLDAETVIEFGPLQLFGIAIVKKKKVYEVLKNLLVGKFRGASQVAIDNKHIPLK